MSFLDLVKLAGIKSPFDPKVFEEVANMTSEQAVNILVQAAQLAQRSGNLTVRDSVMLAKAINTVLPGSL